MTRQMDDGAAYMREHRIRTGYCKNVLVPVAVLRDLLLNQSTGSAGGILRRHFGTDLCQAIIAAPQALGAKRPA